MSQRKKIFSSSSFKTQRLQASSKPLRWKMKLTDWTINLQDFKNSYKMRGSNSRVKLIVQKCSWMRLNGTIVSCRITVSAIKHYLKESASSWNSNEIKPNLTTWKRAANLSQRWTRFRSAGISRKTGLSQVRVRCSLPLKWNSRSNCRNRSMKDKDCSSTTRRPSLLCRKQPET